MTLGLVLGLAGTAFAYGPTPTPTISTSPGSGSCSTAGCTSPVTGSNFDPNEMVNLSGCGIAPVAVTASSTGTFSTSVAIPAGAAGACTITGTGATSGLSATTSFTRTAAVTPASVTTPVASVPLAFTGADISILIAVASIAIAIGGIFVLGSRRRTSTQK
jgi:hypothetical protein